MLDQKLDDIIRNIILPNLILCGDFNLQSTNWEDTIYVKRNPQYGPAVNTLMIDKVDNCNLTQISMEPTRINNILDLVFSINKKKPRSCLYLT